MNTNTEPTTHDGNEPVVIDEAQDASATGPETKSAEDGVPDWVMGSISVGMKAIGNRLAVAAFASFVSIIIALAGGYFAIVKLAVEPVQKEVSLLRDTTNRTIDLQMEARAAMELRLQSQLDGAHADRKAFTDAITENGQRLERIATTQETISKQLAKLEIAQAKILEVVADLREIVAAIDARQSGLEPQKYASAERVYKEVFPNLELSRVEVRLKNSAELGDRIIEIKLLDKCDGMPFLDVRCNFEEDPSRQIDLPPEIEDSPPFDPRSIYEHSTVGSDARLKTDIVAVGSGAHGLTVYNFRYLGSPTVFRGVMAQDVLAVMPNAVSTDILGFLRVNYAMLGMRMEIVD